MMEMRLKRQSAQAWALRALRRCWQRRQINALQHKQQRRRINYLTASWRRHVTCVKVSLCVFFAMHNLTMQSPMKAGGASSC